MEHITWIDVQGFPTNTMYYTEEVNRRRRDCPIKPTFEASPDDTTGHKLYPTEFCVCGICVVIGEDYLFGAMDYQTEAICLARALLVDDFHDKVSSLQKAECGDLGFIHDYRALARVAQSKPRYRVLNPHHFLRHPKSIFAAWLLEEGFLDHPLLIYNLMRDVLTPLLDGPITYEEAMRIIIRKLHRVMQIDTTPHFFMGGLISHAFTLQEDQALIRM